MLRVPSPSLSVLSASSSASFISNEGVHIDRIDPHYHYAWTRPAFLANLVDQFATCWRLWEFTEFHDSMRASPQAGDWLVATCHVDVYTNNDRGQPSETRRLPLFLLAFDDIKEKNVQEIRIRRNVFYVESFSLFHHLDIPQAYLTEMLTNIKTHVSAGPALIIDVETTHHSTPSNPTGYKVLLTEYKHTKHDFLQLHDTAEDPDLRAADHKLCLEDACVLSEFETKERPTPLTTTKYWIWRHSSTFIGGFAPIKGGTTVASQMGRLEFAIESSRNRHRNRLAALHYEHGQDIELIHKTPHAKK